MAVVALQTWGLVMFLVSVCPLQDSVIWELPWSMGGELANK